MFLTTLAGAVADHLGAVFQRLYAAHIDTDGGVVLQRQTAGGGLGVAVHDADLLTQLVYEDNGAVIFAYRTGQTAHGLRHQSRQRADDSVADLALKLNAGDERGDGVDDQHVDSAGAYEGLGDVERLLAGVRLGD